MPIITWECSECKKQQTGGMQPPLGWLEISFWNGERFIRFSFDSYACAGKWCEGRYEEPKGADSE